MKNTLYRIWRIARIPLAIIVVLYVGLVIYRIPAAQERLKTEEAVKNIQSQKLTLADVMGKNLPPEPDAALNNSTVEGIDANNNGIRDDVELAIFKLHPDSARIRAAELQYAMALQGELNDTFNIETLTAAVWEESRGYFCIDSTFPRLPKNASNEELNQQDNDFNSRITEVKNLVLNTSARVQKREDIFNKYMSSHTSPSNDFCDIDFFKLPN
ncbi:MAG TPA: hypothetical protein VMV71_01045 [Candidatus Paceibacterota bacterium]|nr:hypothetical protein [Candidatus Paceibacterota bacterium]